MRRPSLAEYEIYLPLLYNNGRKISENKFNVTFKETRDQYGSESHSYIEKLVGSEKQRRKEPFLRLWVHTYDLPRNDRWFQRYKGILKGRFKQREIYMLKRGKKGLTIL